MRGVCGLRPRLGVNMGLAIGADVDIDMGDATGCEIEGIYQDCFLAAAAADGVVVPEAMTGKYPDPRLASCGCCC